MNQHTLHVIVEIREGGKTDVFVSKGPNWGDAMDQCIESWESSIGTYQQMYGPDEDYCDDTWHDHPHLFREYILDGYVDYLAEIEVPVPIARIIKNTKELSALI